MPGNRGLSPGPGQSNVSLQVPQSEGSILTAPESQIYLSLLPKVAPTPCRATLLFTKAHLQAGLPAHV